MAVTMLFEKPLVDMTSGFFYSFSLNAIKSRETLPCNQVPAE